MALFDDGLAHRPALSGVRGRGGGRRLPDHAAVGPRRQDRDPAAGCAAGPRRRARAPSRSIATRTPSDHRRPRRLRHRDGALARRPRRASSRAGRPLGRVERRRRRAALAEFAAAGVEVKVASARHHGRGRRAGAVRTKFEPTMPPLAGVIHAATVFDDAIVANLTRREARHRAGRQGGRARVLLDRLTAADGSRLFHSLFLGHDRDRQPRPGRLCGRQRLPRGPCARRRLAGLARRSRSPGAPSRMSASWPARASTTTNLLARSGVLGMVARNALDHLAEVCPACRAAAGPGRAHGRVRQLVDGPRAPARAALEELRRTDARRAGVGSAATRPRSTSRR